jgi:hypothetical protein
LCAPNWEGDFIRLPDWQRTTYFLTEAPDPSFPIEVRIDGQLRPSSVAGMPVWSFDASANAVDFVPAQLPRPGSTLEIRYTVACR